MDAYGLELLLALRLLLELHCFTLRIYVIRENSDEEVSESIVET